MDSNNILSEKLQEIVSCVCKVFEKLCDILKKFLKYLAEAFFSSDAWNYIKAWIDACTKNPKSFRYSKYCKKRRIRKKHINRLINSANKIYAERKKAT